MAANSLSFAVMHAVTGAAVLSKAASQQQLLAPGGPSAGGIGLHPSQPMAWQPQCSAGEQPCASGGSASSTPMSAAWSAALQPRRSGGELFCGSGPMACASSARCFGAGLANGAAPAGEAAMSVAAHQPCADEASPLSSSSRLVLETDLTPAGAEAVSGVRIAGSKRSYSEAAACYSSGRATAAAAAAAAAAATQQQAAALSAWRQQALLAAQARRQHAVAAAAAAAAAGSIQQQPRWQQGPGVHPVLSNAAQPQLAQQQRVQVLASQPSDLSSASSGGPSLSSSGSSFTASGSSSDMVALLASSSCQLRLAAARPAPAAITAWQRLVQHHQAERQQQQQQQQQHLLLQQHSSSLAPAGALAGVALLGSVSSITSNGSSSSTLAVLHLQQQQQQQQQPPAKRAATQTAVAALLRVSATAQAKQQQQQQLARRTSAGAAGKAAAAASLAGLRVLLPGGGQQRLLSWAGQVLGCQLGDAFLLSEHIFSRVAGRLDDMLLISLGITVPVECVTMLVSLWVATKLEGHRRLVAGCSKLAGALQLLPWAVTTVELHMMQLLEWQPYAGWAQRPPAAPSCVVSLLD